MADCRGAHARGNVSTVATVTGLFFYPVKSTRGIAPLRARVVATGFEWDRQWMVIDGNGSFLSQRTHPQLAQIVPAIGKHALVLEAAGRAPLSVPLAQAAEPVPVRVHNDRCVGLDQGTAAAAWMSETLGQPVRLVRVPPAPQRVANPKFAGTAPAPMGFADGFPLLVCNQASLDDLNARMPQAIPMERFRPNIVLEGLPAWAEDHIDTLSVGELTLRLVKPCTRCSIPSIDQRTGLPSTNPLPVLRAFRFNRELLGVTFGENAVITSGVGYEIRRGASCRVSFEPAAAAG